MASGSPTLSAIGLGSNLGDRHAHITGAIVAIASLPRTRLLARGPLVASPAMIPPPPPGAADGRDTGFADPGQAGGEYLNTAVLVSTWLAPEELLAGLQRIEISRGRDRAAETRRWSARTIDLDLLLYGTLAMRTPALTLPHPGLAERWFVLEPLVAIWPEALVAGAGAAGAGETVRALAERVPGRREAPEPRATN